MYLIDAALGKAKLLHMAIIDFFSPLGDWRDVYSKPRDT